MSFADPAFRIYLTLVQYPILRVGIRNPERLSSLSLLDTSADREPWKARLRYSALFAVVAAAGFGPAVKPALEAMFGASYLADRARAGDRAGRPSRAPDGRAPPARPAACRCRAPRRTGP